MVRTVASQRAGPGSERPDRPGPFPVEFACSPQACMGVLPQSKVMQVWSTKVLWRQSVTNLLQLLCCAPGIHAGLHVALMVGS